MANRGVTKRLWVLAAAIAVLDFVSKFLTHQFLPTISDEMLWYPYGGIAVFRDFLGIEFSLSHTTNTGAAWGIFGGFQHGLLAFRVALILALIGYLTFFNKQKEYRVPLVLIVTGASLNVLDFFIYGHVVDMIHFIFWGYDFPVFNVADASIFCGISWLIVLSLFAEPDSEKAAKKKV